MATGFEFRKKLFFISNQLGAKELKDLKFLVDDDLAQMVKEKIKTPFELLCALEDSGKITEEDTSLLVQLLDAIKRKHLLNTSPGPTSVPSSLMTKGGYSRAQLKPFLVNSISDKLSLCDLRNIICFFFKRNDFTLGYHKLEKIGNPTELFELLFEQQVLNVGKLSSLWEVLSIIGRRDLCTAITKFHSESQTQPPANPSLTTPTNPQAASEETREHRAFHFSNNIIIYFPLQDDLIKLLCLKKLRVNWCLVHPMGHHVSLGYPSPTMCLLVTRNSRQ